MASLIDKIELLIKREKTTPERKKKDESAKSSSEILSELFGAFNAAPPKIEEVSKKSKKNKGKHKKDKKKRSRSSSSNESDDSEISRKRKKRKKTSKSKKRPSSISPSHSRSSTPPKIKPDPELTRIKPPPEQIKTEKVKTEPIKEVKTEEKHRRVTMKTEDSTADNYDVSLIPLPDENLDSSDLRHKIAGKKTEATDNDKSKGKIQIKNLKFSAVFEETVKKAEEEAKKKASRLEEGEYTDSSSVSEKDETSNSQFPKTSDPGGILKKQAADSKLHEDDSRHSRRSTDRSHKSSRRDTSRSRRRRSRSRSRSVSRRRRSSSRSRRRSSRDGRSGRRRRSRSRSRARRRSPSAERRRRLERLDPRRRRSRERSPTGVRLADHEKKRLLEVARRNAINMLKNGAVPAGAAALPPHTRSQVMAAIQSGGKSVDELTDFCKHLSKKEALGELSSVSENDSDMSENEDTLAFHHPFLVKEKAPIVMNIRGGAPLPVKSLVPIANKDELRLQFPVSSGTQHRDKGSEWVPVEPKKDMQVAKLTSKPPKPVAAPTEKQVLAPVAPPAAPTAAPAAAPTAAPAVAPAAAPTAVPAAAKDNAPYMKSSGQLVCPSPSATPVASVLPAALPAPAPQPLPAPGPQAYPPGVQPPPTPKTIDISSIVSEKLLMIRKAQERNETSTLGWSSRETRSLGQFTGSTGVQILTPRELASGVQAWAKKDQLQRAAPVAGGMGMHLLQKMGWTPGQGLGKEGTGTLQPLLLEVKLDTRGLTAKEEGARKAGVRLPRQGRRGPAPVVAGGKHPVSLLGEYCSKNKLGPPEYTLCFECGPDHKKNFLFRVKIAGTEYQPAVASANKKQAKADSAQLALQTLGVLRE